MEGENKNCSSDISSKIKEIEIEELLSKDLVSLISKYSHSQKKESNGITENSHESNPSVRKNRRPTPEYDF